MQAVVLLRQSQQPNRWRHLGEDEVSVQHQISAILFSATFLHMASTKFLPTSPNRLPKTHPESPRLSGSLLCDPTALTTLHTLIVAHKGLMIL